MAAKITVSVSIQSNIEKIWDMWNNPQHIVKWNTADDASWHTPSAENNLEVNKKFKYRMEAKDGSMGFDFEGTYTDIILFKKISYIMPDGRVVDTTFTPDNKQILVTSIFDAEEINSPDFQQQGWQSILNNFKKFVENN